MAAILILIVQIYAGIGALVAAIFLTVGMGRVEENARGAYVFRPLLIPGVLLIWPIVLLRWWQIEGNRLRPAARHEPPLKIQRWLGFALGLLLPLIVMGALALRQDGPFERPAVLLEAPQ